MATVIRRYAISSTEGKRDVMKILLVDDSEAIRARLRTVIGELCCGASVAEARTEPEAAEAAERVAPDLVILDLNLAEGSGLGVLNALRRHEAMPRVAVLTTHAEQPYRKKCLASGAEWFFDKAQGCEALYQLIVALCAQFAAGGQKPALEG